MFAKIKAYFKDTPANYKEKVLTHGVQNIPAGAVILTRARGNLISYLIRKVTTNWCNHSGLYFGSGKHETVEALPGGVMRATLDSYLGKDSQFEVWMKRDLTVVQLAIIKGYAYGCCGKRYGWTDLLSYVLKPFKKMASERTMICSEVVTLSYNAAGIRTSLKAGGETTPGDLRDYFQSEAGKKDRWCLWDTFNC